MFVGRILGHLIESMKLLNCDTQGPRRRNGTTLETSAHRPQSPSALSLILLQGLPGFEHLSPEFLVYQMIGLVRPGAVPELISNRIWVLLGRSGFMPKDGGDFVSWAATARGMWVCRIK